MKVFNVFCAQATWCNRFKFLWMVEKHNNFFPLQGSFVFAVKKQPQITLFQLLYCQHQLFPVFSIEYFYTFAQYTYGCTLNWILKTRFGYIVVLAVEHVLLHIVLVFELDSYWKLLPGQTVASWKKEHYFYTRQMHILICLLQCLETSYVWASQKSISVLEISSWFQR